MRSSLVLAGCAASALLTAGPADAFWLETTCENIKLRAAGAYARCLAEVAKHANSTGDTPSDAAIERCNQRFDRAFERAEATGACRTAGGPSSLRGPIQGQMAETFEATTARPGCPSAPVRDGSTYVCTLKTGSAIDLAEIVVQIDVPDVTLESIVWIEAWGAAGGPGNTSNGGGGGSGGYAQTTTSIIDLPTTTIHYYLGKAGTGGANAGGDGGTATLVTFDDLTKEAPSLDNTLLIAGGGGGGGGGRGTSTACGDGSDLDVLGGGGGAGGDAIAETGGPKSGAGVQGGERRGTNVSGFGGSDGNGGSAGGGSGHPGQGGIAALGGIGGNHSDPTVGFINQSGVKIPASGGEGGHPGDDAGGGGGGGGYGGGGGGREGTGASDCVSGGGGGGASWALTSTESCTRSQPGGSPNGSAGAVQIVFQAGPCG